MRRFIVIPLLVAAAACQGGDGAPERATLVDSRDTYDPRSLDPALSTDVPTGRAVGYVFDGLVGFTPDAQVAPALATRWELSPDGLTYTFHLRRNVAFHDGAPFTARHVVRSFERVLDPRSRGGRAEPLMPIRGARDFNAGRAPRVVGLTAPDDSTVVIALAEPLASFPKLLAMPVASIVPDSTPADFGEHPVGTGPWTFVAWKQTDEKKAMLQTAPALILYYVALNTTRGPLTDGRVRQAINHAVDTKTILTQLMGGRGYLAPGVVSPILDGADTSRTRYAYDVAKAKELLTAAGHPSGIDIELWHSQDPTI